MIWFKINQGGNASRLGRRRILILDDLKSGKRYWELKKEVENRFGVHTWARTCFLADHFTIISELDAWLNKCNEEGVAAGSCKIFSLMYADDVVLLASAPEDMKEKLEKQKSSSKSSNSILTYQNQR